MHGVKEAMLTVRRTEDTVASHISQSWQQHSVTKGYLHEAFLVAVGSRYSID